jgi:hypothetical protein
MTKHGMRGFASGIIATTAVVALFHFQLTPKSEATTDSNASLTENTVQKYLNSHGEIAVDKEMFNKWQNSEKKGTSKSTDSNTKSDDKTSDKSTKDNSSGSDTTTESPQVYKATVQVTQGMTTSDVAAELESQHVIKNKYDLIHYVVNNKLEPYLQLGTFTLSSDMTIAQIASKLTNH